MTQENKSLGLVSANTPEKFGWIARQEGRVGYALAWLLGVPLPILVIIYLFRGH